MKPILLILLSLMLIGNVHADDTIGTIDTLGMAELLSKVRVNPCYDYDYNATLLLPDLYERQQHDSIKAVLDFWNSKCGSSQNSLRTRLLLDIRYNRFRENLLEPSIINELVNYRARTEHVMSWGYGGGYWDSGWEDAYHKFDRFLTLIAEDAKENFSENSTEHFMCEFYQGEFDLALNRLKSDKFKDTRIQRYYYNAIDELLENRGNRKYWAMNAGTWIPQGDLEILGEHPMTGGSYGFKYDKYELDLTWNFRYLKSPNTYTVHNKDQIDSTDHFFNFYIGVNGAYEFKRAGSFSWLLLAGVGAEGFHTIDDETVSEDKKVVLWSPTGQLGFGTRFYFSKYRTWFITANIRYHFLGFDTDGGTSLSGNATSIGITIGAFEFGRVNNKLKLLNHYK